jgi:hypothetical protein
MATWERDPHICSTAWRMLARQSMRFEVQQFGIFIPSYERNGIALILVSMQEQSTEKWLALGTNTGTRGIRSIKVCIQTRTLSMRLTIGMVWDLRS